MEMEKTVSAVFDRCVVRRKNETATQGVYVFCMF